MAHSLVEGYGLNDGGIVDNEKSIYMLTGEQVLGFCVDLSLHIGVCKQRGWALQEAVTAATTIEELNEIKWAE